MALRRCLQGHPPGRVHRHRDRALHARPERPARSRAAQRAEYRDIIRSEGLTFAGLHWLMVSPKGLHVTGPDAALRRRSWDHIRALIDLCADLGPDGVMVFGSPNQRSHYRRPDPRAGHPQLHRWPGRSRAARREIAASRCWWRRCPPRNRDVVQTLAEAVAIVQRNRQPRHTHHVRRAQCRRRAGIARRAGGPLLRFHPPRARQRTRRPPLRHGRLRFQAGASKSCSAAGTRAGSRSKPSISRPAPERLANESLRHLENQINQLPS